MLQRTIGVAMMVFPFAIFAFLVRLWPIAMPSTGTTQTWSGIWDCATCDGLPFEPRMILIVLLAGALGSSIHTATSYASYVGSRKFVASWGWWYFLRIPVGMGLAVVLYFALRGGFFTPLSGEKLGAQDVVNPFGFAAIAAMAGMFSKQATDKLKELFDGLFRTEEDAGRADKLATSNPTIENVEPQEVKVGSAGTKIVVAGTGFVEGSKVMVNQEWREAALTGADRLTVTLKAKDAKVAQTLKLVVVNPAEQGGRSEETSIIVK